MNTYLIDLHFLKPFESFGETVTEHRAFLQGGYDQGMLLVSGPKADRSGGIVIARAPDEETLKRFLAHDPYKRSGLAEHRIIPFAAVKFAPFLESWIRGAASITIGA